MKRFRRAVWQAVLAGGLACLLPGMAQAQPGTVGTVTASAGPPLMRVSSAVAGFEPNPVTGTATITVKAQKSNKPQQVTAQLNAAMPAGLTLTLDMTTPTGATSQGTVTLDATARALMGNIKNLTAETETLTYTFTATTAAGVVAADSRTVTFTITSWP